MYEGQARKTKASTPSYIFGQYLFLAFPTMVCYVTCSTVGTKTNYCVIILEAWKYVNFKDAKSVKMQSCLVFDFKDLISVFLPPQISFSCSSAQLQF